jgi:F-type H+-transporting ATPase subunit delta
MPVLQKMPKRTNQIAPYAHAYAQSLLELANEQNLAPQIGSELEQLRQIIDENPTFRLFLSDPAIGETERGDVIKRVFEKNVSPLLYNFLRVLNAHGRLRGLSGIIDAYDDLLDSQLGKVEVDVTVAQKLSPQQLDQVRDRVSAALKKQAVLHQYVDPNLIGGMVVRVQDKLIDASVRTQLAAMKQQMLSGT